MKKKSTQKGVAKSPRKARGAVRMVRIKRGAKNLTRRAGLIPVLKFHERVGLAGLLDKALAQCRGASAVYTLGDAMRPTIVGLIGGARSLLQVVRLWVSELPESWRARLTAARDARVTVRIEEEVSAIADVGSAFGMWRNRADLADVAAYVRRLRAPRFGQG